MNKKFSTLVAALLVTGGSFAMVSQYAGSPLTESPIAMAAAANLRAMQVTGYDLVAADFDASKATVWTLASGKLKTAEGYYLTADAKLSKRESDALRDFTYDADKHIVSTSKGTLVITGAGLSFKNAALTETDTPATFFKTADSYGQEAKGASSYVSYMGQEVYTYKMGAKQFTLTNSSGFGVAKINTGYTGLENYLAQASKVQVVKDANNNLFLKIVSLGGTARYLAADATGNLSYEENLPTGDQYNNSIITVRPSGVIAVGGKALAFTGTGDGLEVNDSADSNFKVCFYQEGISVLMTAPAESTDYYLIDVVATSRTDISTQTGPNSIWLAKLAASTDATASQSNNGTEVTLTADGKIKLNHDYVKADGFIGEINEAETFNVAENGAIEGLYIDATNGLTTTPNNTPAFAYNATTNEVLTGLPQTGAQIKITNRKASLTKLVNVKVAQAKAVTGDVLDKVTLGIPAALTTDAYYWLLDNAGTKTMVPSSTTTGGVTTWSLEDKAVSSITDKENVGLWKVTAVKWNQDGAATHYSFTYRDNDQVPLAFSIKFNKETKKFEAPKFDPNGKYTAFYVDAHTVGNNTYNYLTFVSDEKVEYRGETFTDQQTYGLQQKNGEWTMVELSDACEEMKITMTDNIDITGSNNAAEWVKWLNTTAGNGQGFGLAYILDGKKQTLEENVLTEGVTAVQGPDLSSLKSVGENLSGKMFLKISGDYEYKAPSSYATAAQKQALADAQLADFRASKFVAVDTVLYSSIINDADQYYYLVSVAGSDMVSTKGQVAADKSYDQLYNKNANGYVGSLLTRRIENAEFEVYHAKGSTIEDPVYVKVPEVRLPVSYNEKGITDVNSAGTDGHKNVGPMYVAIKNYNKKLYVGAAADVDSKANFIVTKNNDVDFTKVNGIVNIISRNYKRDGQVMANADYNGLTWVLPQYVALDKPEGQYLVTGGDYNKYGEIQKFTFTNRESGRAWDNVALKATDKENIYSVVGTNDTIEVKAANAGDEFIGYANYSAAKLANSKFVLKVVSKVGGVDDLYITEDHNKDHSLGLDADTTASATFRLIKFEEKKSAAKAYGDTVYVNTNEYSYVNSKKEYAEKADRVVAFTYAIYNADNMEFLAWNGQGSTKEQYFYSNPDKKYNEQVGAASAAGAQRFIIKEKNDGTVQLLPVSPNFGGENPANFAMTYSKVYVGLSDNKLHGEATIYKIADNDLFRVVEVGAPMYRKLDGEVYDKVRIYKEGMQNVAMFAESTDAAILSGKNFLGMEHKADADLAKTMFSFMVDTAYVNRADNYKPQYLLAIDTEIVPEATYCPEHGLNSDCSHTTKKIGYAKGSYLVCLSDSAAAWDASKAHNNPYKYDGYARLGFVKATHIGDTLAIERGKAVKADTLNLKSGMTEASFALRIVDQDSKSFVMETKDGWIKWLNGVPVVVPTLAQAEVLNIEATENAATANEAIAAEGVQVIGGQGVVTVQGAAGKVITVANILGQTIANQVAASDNVTIAAPAGVVVVAVDGEATKVVVK